MMFDFKKHDESPVMRPGIYCVWIPAHLGKETPLIRIWIDPSMSTFESQAAIREPEVAAASGEDAAQVSRGHNS